MQQNQIGVLLQPTKLGDPLPAGSCEDHVAENLEVAPVKGADHTLCNANHGLLGGTCFNDQRLFEGVNAPHQGIGVSDAAERLSVGRNLRQARAQSVYAQKCGYVSNASRVL